MSNQTHLTIVGVVLAGGLSRRMFAGQPVGGDKGLLDLAGRTMIDHVIHRLAPQVSHMVVNANGDPDRLEHLHKRLWLPVVADTVEGFVGPLAGVLAGMRWTAAHVPAVTHIVSVSSDAPFLPGDLVARLAAAAAGQPPKLQHAIAMARSLGELHPVIALWPVVLADDLEAALRSGVRKVLVWTDRHGTIPVDFSALDIGGTAVDPFFNANTPAELDEARRLLALMAA
ncbi:MAG: molybdenum cofactor guanylyltransferase MobA [Hyphomicrobiaceae bacterium]